MEIPEEEAEENNPPLIQDPFLRILLDLMAEAWQAEELWVPPEAVPKEVMATWPDDAPINALIEQMADTNLEWFDRAAVLSSINAIRARRYFEWKYPEEWETLKRLHEVIVEGGEYGEAQGRE